MHQLDIPQKTHLGGIVVTYLNCKSPPYHGLGAHWFPGVLFSEAVVLVSLPKETGPGWGSRIRVIQRTAVTDYTTSLRIREGPMARSLTMGLNHLLEVRCYADQAEVEAMTDQSLIPQTGFVNILIPVTSPDALLSEPPVQHIYIQGVVSQQSIPHWVVVSLWQICHSEHCAALLLQKAIFHPKHNHFLNLTSLPSSQWLNLTS